MLKVFVNKFGLKLKQPFSTAFISTNESELYAPDITN